MGHIRCKDHGLLIPSIHQPRRLLRRNEITRDPLAVRVTIFSLQCRETSAGPDGGTAAGLCRSRWARGEAAGGQRICSPGTQRNSPADSGSGMAIVCHVVCDLGYTSSPPDLAAAGDRQQAAKPGRRKGGEGLGQSVSVSCSLDHSATVLSCGGERRAETRRGAVAACRPRNRSIGGICMDGHVSYRGSSR